MGFIGDYTPACSDDTLIYFLDIKIQQPITALTDFFITLTCWYIFFRSKKELPKNQVTVLFRYFFLVMGLGTLAGGLFGHALCYKYGVIAKLPGWIISMIAIMLCERSAIMHTKDLFNIRTGKFFATANIIELLLLIAITSVTLNFFFVEFHAFYGLLIVTGSFELYNYIKTRSAAAKRILFSVCISFIAAIIHIAHISPAIWFNYLDLAHCIMCLSAWVMYTGIRMIDTAGSKL